MNEQQLAGIERKNSWLYDLVDVEFPTPESLKGRDIYFQALKQVNYQIVDKGSLLSGESAFKAEDIFLVDFHRLTIMFSILQSQRWVNQHDQQMIVEYLTQIILTPDFELYVGFIDGSPTGASIVSQFEGSTLVSDIAVSGTSDKSQFIGSLVKKLDNTNKLSETIICEC